jgi:hypothetical protein
MFIWSYPLPTMGKDLEELGPQQMQILCGWLLITSAGRLIGWLKEDCLIWSNALFAIRKRRQRTI